MSWSLQIDIPQRKYKGGDTVSGSVRLVSQDTRGQNVDVESITIAFTGRSITSKSWHRTPNSIEILSFKENLFDGPKRLFAPYFLRDTAGSNVWPFSFTLPRTCSHYPEETLSRPPLPPFDSYPFQSLPASFADANVQGTCSIMYELQARLVSPLKDGCHINKGCTEEVYISVYKPRSIQQPMFNYSSESATFKHRSLLLLPKDERERPHRHPTIKEKLSLKTPLTKHLPKAVFTIRAETPSDAILGHKMPLMLHVDYDINASTAIIPVFYLKGVTIHLREETYIWWSKSWTQETMLQKKSFDIQRPRIAPHLDLSKMMDTTIPHDQTPTFETFNVARTYSLKVSVRLECAGKEQLVFGDYQHLTLHARECDSETTTQRERAPVVNEEAIDPPPPYRMATQETVPEYSTRAASTGNRGRSRAAGQNRAVASDAAEPFSLFISGSRATGTSAGGIFFMSL